MRMQIWPAIDIRNGKCVRLRQGDYRQETVYGSSPADMAHRWVADGATGLHIVDLDGARDGVSRNHDAIAEIARQINVPIQVGGGIRDVATMDHYHEMGIKRWVIGTRALQDPQWVRTMIDRFPDQILIGIDALDGYAVTDGWLKKTQVSAVEFARQISAQPIAGIIYTDISKDGMLSGPNLEAMRQMQQAVDVPVIASGGVTTADDIVRLAALGLAGCIVGRALYEGRLTLDQAIDAAGTGVSTS
jgi:phosphoribosylformimino-5-aminoimidazole carboxamide ribotide isomerase